VKEKFL